MHGEEIIDDFVRWSGMKISLHRRQSVPFFNQGELWWCSIGMNVGQEVFGKGDRFLRPILVLRKITNHLLLGIPLTTKEKSGAWHVEVEHRNKKRVAILSQVRVLDSRRLLKRIGTLDRSSLLEVVRSFVAFYHLK